MEYACAGKYKLEKQIGHGGFGAVFMGSHTVAGKQVAIKVENANTKHSLLKRESKIYRSLMGGPGVPWIMWSGKQGDYNFMVIDLLGPSLEDLFRMCNKSFSLKTVLLLADQLLHLIEYLHSRAIIHRDIKPANFLMGVDAFSTSQDSSSKRVKMVDFGVAKKYANTRTGEHIPYSQSERHCVGTPLFASINTHQGEDCSRRDDMESLAYTLIYFLRGSLPWRKLVPHNPDLSPSPRHTWDLTLTAKLEAEAADPSPLTNGLPEEFDVFYRYARGLQFTDLPDYAECRNMFRRLAERYGIEYDGQFDWSVGSPPPAVKNRTTASLGRASRGGHAKHHMRRYSEGRSVRHCAACMAREEAEAASSKTWSS